MTDTQTPQEFKDAVLAPVARIRELGANNHALASLLEQMIHTLLAGPQAIERAVIDGVVPDAAEPLPADTGEDMHGEPANPVPTGQGPFQ